MDLKNTKRHMQGARLSVDGRFYQLDDQGIVRGVPDVDAHTLLQGKDWVVVAGKLPPAPAPAPRPPVKVKPVPQPAQLVTPGTPVALAGGPPPGQAIPLPQPALALPAPQPVDEPFPEEEEEEEEFADELEEKMGEEEVAPPPAQQAPAAEGATADQAGDLEPHREDWPAPSEEMTVAYLKDMADAWDVKVPRGVKKSDLVRLIQAARAEGTKV